MAAGIEGFLWATGGFFILLSLFTLDHQRRTKLDFYVSGLFLGISVSTLVGAMFITF
jgi:hypothetical protein